MQSSANNSFDQFNLNPKITQALRACGYVQPTVIQASCIPEILLLKDLIGCSGTGSGKTAAFIIPILNALSSAKKTGKIRALVLAPTRELGDQITKVVNTYSKFLTLHTVSLLGGMSYSKQIKSLSRGADIIVATPGRLLDFIKNHKLDLSHVETLVLDEADRMLDMGFIDDIRFIAKKVPVSRQTLLFTATLSPKLIAPIKDLLKAPVTIDLLQQKVSPKQIKQELYLVDSHQHKEKLLQYYLKNNNIYKAIIFCATQIGTEKLAKQLSQLGHVASALHGGLKQTIRNRTIKDFHSGKIALLIATDVAGRGLDVKDVTHVINNDLPKFSEDYLHRIGRTGRAGQTGTAISFALPEDFRHVVRIEKYVGEKLQRLTVSGLEPKKSFGGQTKDNNKKNDTRFKNKKKAFSFKKRESANDKKPKPFSAKFKKKPRKHKNKEI